MDLTPVEETVYYKEVYGEGVASVALKMKAKGYAFEAISEVTGLTAEELRKLFKDE